MKPNVAVTVALTNRPQFHITPCQLPDNYYLPSFSSALVVPSADPCYL
jgi:hypothetical protein